MGFLRQFPVVQIPHLAVFSVFQTSLCPTAFCWVLLLPLVWQHFCRKSCWATQGERCHRSTVKSSPLSLSWDHPWCCPQCTLVWVGRVEEPLPGGFLWPVTGTFSGSIAGGVYGTGGINAGFYHIILANHFLQQMWQADLGLPEESVCESWRSSALGSFREADTAGLETLEVIARERNMRKLLPSPSDVCNL